MSKYYWMIDAGHGGMRNGVYTTAPAKMVKYPDGFLICEGEVNRAIAKMVYTQLMQNQIDFCLLYDDIIDTALKGRVKIANDVYARKKNAVLLSIHSNASKGGIDDPGEGLEIYTTPGKTRSDGFADVFIKHYKQALPEFKFRTDLSDGDHDKEARFYILCESHSPALLVENLFMDNRKEAEFLMTEMGRLRIANAIVKAILECETKTL
jgi:N-acetylmuramoyl-L-alanine amidase